VEQLVYALVGKLILLAKSHISIVMSNVILVLVVKPLIMNVTAIPAIRPMVLVVVLPRLLITGILALGPVVLFPVALVPRPEP